MDYYHLNTQMGILQREDLRCPHCEAYHFDIDEWADKPHQTHLCLCCNKLFEGTVKAVSRPLYHKEYLERKVNKFINAVTALVVANLIKNQFNKID